MKVHLSQIPDEGLHIEGEEDAAILELDDPLFRCKGPVHFAVDVGLSDGGLFATGKLEVEMEVECVSCLERFIFPMRVENFAMQTELTGSETVDLTPFVREDILLALPTHPHCDWDGRKPCEGALKSLPVLAKPDEPVAGAAEAWSALDKLKLKKRK
jgi:uncharacterized protein